MGTLSSGSVLSKVASGAGWVIGWRLATRLLGLGNTLALAHLLLPSDFGLVALGAGFLGAVDSLSDLGVEESVIRIKEPGRELYDTGFTLNVLRGLGTAAIVAGLSVPAAIFFRDLRLGHVMLALAAGTLMLGFENIGIVDFRRNLAFHKEFQLMLLPRLVSIAVAIGTAAVCRSYWALIVAILTAQTLRVGMSYLIHPFRPRFTLRAWRDLAGFSLWTWALSMVGLFRDRCDSFVIGRILGPAEVGVYLLGWEIAHVPTSELGAALARAAFSGFSAARHAGIGVTDTYLRIVASSVLIFAPIGVGISLVADLVVKLALGSKWQNATPVLEILGPAGSITTFVYISSALFSAYGFLSSSFRLQIAGTAVRLVLLIPLVMILGIAGAAIAAAAAMTIETILYLVATLRRFGLHLSDLLRLTWRGLFATGAMAASLYMTGLGWHHVSGNSATLFTRLVVAVSAGAAIYVAVLALAWLAAGRPGGGEADLLELMNRSLAGLRRRKPAISV
jgi:lipopolysaccharide exporter